MSAGICGKRVGFEEMFGSSSSSAKRSRCSNFGSPEFGSGSDDTYLTLLQVFPALDPELVRSIYRSHNNNTDDAIKALMKISSGDSLQRNKLQSSESAATGNCGAAEAPNTATCFQMSDHEGENVSNCGNSISGSKWVDLFVQEMINAANLDDARSRAAQILEAFERRIATPSHNSKQLENASLKEYLQSLLNDNQILKRAIAIQHERNLEQEEKMKDVQNLKILLNQYQEQIQTLELNNYALKLHLQSAHQNPILTSRFNPDVC